MMTTTGTSGRDATLSANLGEHQRHVPSAVAMQIAPMVVPRINLRVNRVIDAVDAKHWSPCLKLFASESRLDRRALERQVVL